MAATSLMQTTITLQLMSVSAAAFPPHHRLFLSVSDLPQRW